MNVLDDGDGRIDHGADSDGDYERIQNAENLPYDCFRHFFEKWSTCSGLIKTDTLIG
jgi:hypothetical protein